MLIWIPVAVVVKMAERIYLDHGCVRLKDKSFNVRGEVIGGNITGTRWKKTQWKVPANEYRKNRRQKKINTRQSKILTPDRGALNS